MSQKITKSKFVVFVPLHHFHFFAQIYVTKNRKNKSILLFIHHSLPFCLVLCHKKIKFIVFVPLYHFRFAQFYVTKISLNKLSVLFIYYSLIRPVLCHKKLEKLNSVFCSFITLSFAQFYVTKN